MSYEIKKITVYIGSFLVVVSLQVQSNINIRAKKIFAPRARVSARFNKLVGIHMTIYYFKRFPFNPMKHK